MDRRFVIWLVLSYVLLVFFWPRPKRPPADEADKPLAAAEQDQAGEAPADVPAPLPNGEPLPAEERVEVQRITLGSLDEASGYRMLATITNRGAAVERIELAGSRYSDLQDRGGYLGHLALEASTDGGLVVGLVGAGTPAAKAGVQPGDRLISAGPAEKTEPLESIAQLKERLLAARPGQDFTLQVMRNGQKQTLRAKLVRRPLEVIRPESENAMLWQEKLPGGFVEPGSFQLTLHQIGGNVLPRQPADESGAPTAELPGVRLTEANWRVVDHDESSATFQRRLPESGLQITKRYRLARAAGDQGEAPANHFFLDISIENLSGAEQTIAYQLDGPNGLPIEGWWYANKIGYSWSGVGLRDVMGRAFDAKVGQFPPAEIAEGEVDALEGAPLAYLGVDAQYFAAMMIPQKEAADELWIERAELKRLGPKPQARSTEGRYANVTPRLISMAQPVAPGGNLEHTYQVFAGPKRPELIEQYRAVDDPAYSLSDLITYGWFSTIAKGMLWVLHFFYSIFGNYGIAIIMLTVLVRSCMFPISRKQAQSMMRMQELRPEMERIKEKYKTDMQKQSQAMQELYRKNGVNPLAGCLPMLIQLPVFVGLYRGLAVDIELRQAALFGESIRWCSNLAAPDMFLNWSAIMPEFINRGEGILGLGPYLNVLPLITIFLFLLQQKLFMPEPANEQAAMQQKIMKYMMVFMGLLFYKVPSGLCIYFIASSVWGIAERKLLPKAPDAPDSPTPSKTTDSGGGTKRLPEKKSSGQTRAAKNGKAAGKRRSKSKRKR